MRRITALLWLCTAAWTASSAGCTMCRSEHLCDYATVGGKWQRSNPACGRVGSNLSDAGAYQAGSGVEMGANFGDAWNLVEPDGVPQDAPIQSQIIDGELFESGPTPAVPEPGSIMIGP